ncbi:MAG: tRNA pseudouridine(55) synthase TruB [Betaproteobacteria bacterium]|nr:tRNA pseudouridine(55) synthase TruB [Betaproteobacteria bacterium]
MRRRLDGVLLLDTPVGPSSSAVLQAVKRLLEAEKAGHAGTLDPLASGLLPLLFGEATKFAQFGLDSIKEYRAQVRLGVSTDTGDAEGQVLERRPAEVAETGLERALARFRGAIEQVPPMYSALKHGGRPLYALARAGQTVERAARHVMVHELELLEHAGDVLHLRIKCSKGTYVRQLAVDLGLALGTVAHLEGLRRTAVGGFRLAQAVTLDDLQALGEGARRAWLLPPDSLLGDLPRLDLPDELAQRFLNGQAVALAALSQGPCRVYGKAGVLLGVGEGGPGDELRPARLVARA